MAKGDITFDYGGKKVIVNDDGTKVTSQPEQSEVKSKTKDHSDQEELQTNDITKEDIELRIEVQTRADKLNEKKKQTKIPLHPSALSGLTGEIVNEILPETEADEINLLMSLVTYVGNYLGREAYFKIEGTKQFLCFYTAMIGPSSTARKGTGRDHIDNIFMELDPAYTSKRIKSGWKTGEGIINLLRDDELNEEGEVVDLVIDRRLLVFEPELSFLLKSFKDNNISSEVLRDFYDRGRGQTISKRNPQEAHGHLSLLGHATPIELNKLITTVDIANGTANRFLWLNTQGSKVLPFGGADIDYKKLATKLRPVLEHGKSIKRMTRSPRAKIVFAVKYMDLKENERLGTEELLSRAEVHITRLSMYYAIMDKRSEIQPQDIESAWAIYEYHEKSINKIFPSNPLSPVAKKIYEALQTNQSNEYFKEQDIDYGLNRTQIHELTGRKLHKEEITKLVKELQDRDLVEEITTPTAGTYIKTIYLKGTAPNSSDSPNSLEE